jgi:prepilin-type N-terminal cleavage/methylation domain-containing protein
MTKFPVNEKGLTLIEVLASIVLLSVVIVSFLSLFPQITQFNNVTEKNLQAAAVAKEVRVLVKDQEIDFMTPTLLGKLSTLTPSITEDDITFTGIYNSFTVNIIIDKSKEVSGEVQDLFQMKISVMNDANKEISYTYGYIVNTK